MNIHGDSNISRLPHSGERNCDKDALAANKVCSREMISAYLDGELDDAQREEVRAHLENCAECQTYLAELTALRGALGDMEEYDAPEGFAESVLARLHEDAGSKQKTDAPKAPKTAWRRFVPLAACAAVVVLAATVLPNTLRMGKSADSTAAAPSAPMVSETFTAAAGDMVYGDGATKGSEYAAKADENTMAAMQSTVETLESAEDSGERAAPAAEAEERESDLLLYGENAEYWLWTNGEWNEEQNGYWVDRETLSHLPDGLTLGDADALARWKTNGRDFAFVRAAETEAGR